MAKSRGSIWNFSLHAEKIPICTRASTGPPRTRGGLRVARRQQGKKGRSSGSFMEISPKGERIQSDVHVPTCPPGTRGTPIFSTGRREIGGVGGRFGDHQIQTQLEDKENACFGSVDVANGGVDGQFYCRISRVQDTERQLSNPQGLSAQGALLRPFSTTSMRADAEKSKKSGSAVKRARQAEERRIRNKSRKTLIKTRMKKVFKSLDEVKVSSSPSEDDFIEINKLISEAQSAIDKAVK
ncbi:hypothetical protein KI387_022037, partial [Taxus chinensis]